MKKSVKFTFAKILLPTLLLVGVYGVQTAMASVVQLDTTFNTIGYVTHDNAAGGSGEDKSKSLQIQSDGKYVVAGYSTNATGNWDLAIWRYNQDGTLDTTFNTVGYISHDGAAGGIGNDKGKSLQIQSDGKYVITGYSANTTGNWDLAIWRYNQDGTLDTTFNTVGYVTHDSAAGGNGDDGGWSLQIQSDGKYVIAGYSINATGNRDLAVWRYNPDGTLDTTFNTVGYVTHDSAAGGIGRDVGKFLQIQSDGKYVVAGHSANAAGNQDLAIWRYNPDGTLDITFNATGYVTHNNAAGGSDKDRGNSLQIQSDGKYVIAGLSTNATGNRDLAVWRYNPDGTLDTTFNTVGYITHDNAAGGNSDDIGRSLQTQSDGKYVVTGYSINAAGSGDLTIWRYNPAGTLDTTFNATGYVTHNNAAGGNSDDASHAFQIQTDEKYVIAGNSTNTAGNRDLAVWRYENLYQIASLDAILDAEAGGINIELGSPNGVSGTTTVSVVKLGVPIAEAQTEMTEDRDWTTVLGNTDGISWKSFINMTGAEGVSGTYTLYVPRNMVESSVGICPNVSSLAAVSNTCTNLEYRSMDDPSVTVVTIGRNEYFQITGLGNAGGFSSLNNPPTDIQIDGGNSDTIPENSSTINIGTLTATDLDRGDTHIFSLTCTTSGTDDSYFMISGNQLQNTTTFDFENPVDANADNIYGVCIVADDGNGGLYEKTITVAVTNLSDIIAGGRRSRESAPPYRPPEEDKTQETKCSHPFVDIDGHWAEEYIEHLYCNDVIRGKIFLEFIPEDEITRAEFLKMILKVFDYKTFGDKDSIFSDIEPDMWYTSYINTGYEEGIISGYSDKAFGPNKDIIQAEALKILLLGAGFEIDETEVQTGKWYDKYINAAIKEEMITEFLTPEATISRAEAANMLSKVLSTGEIKWDLGK